MKNRFILLVLLAFLLAACNFSLAEDITPPPNYVPPTPMPTLGPLYPAEAPSVENGAAIYAEKCAACHGDTGMGDGAQGKQLPVTVAALALPQAYRPAAPADWFTIVSRGNIERFMPPFAGGSGMGQGLTEQQRWDVVAYAQSLHTTPESLAQGQALFETNCAGCPLDYFKDQTVMASLSTDEIVALLKSGSENVTALTGNLSDADLYTVADYLRSLTFASSLPTPTPEPATATPSAAAPEATAAGTEAATTPAGESITPSTEALTPVATEASAATPEATVVASGGKVSGVVNGENVAGLKVTLHGYDHAADASGPQETLTLTGTTDENGAYVFENLDMPEGRIFLAEVVHDTVTYQTDFVMIKAGETESTLPALTVSPTSTDYKTLSFSDARFFVTLSEDGKMMQVVGVYTLVNNTDKTVIVESTNDVPFLKFPDGATNFGFDLTQDSAPLLLADAGFAIPPSETPYGFVAFYNLPYSGKDQVVQSFELPAGSLMVLVPEGMKLQSDQLIKGDVQTMQDLTFQGYNGIGMSAGASLTFELSGRPKTNVLGAANSRQNLLIGVGALGLVFILAGVWLFLRDRNRGVDEEEEEEEEVEFETQDEVLDAIIALDDLHRAGKISDEPYQQRRTELKERLKNLS